MCTDTISSTNLNVKDPPSDIRGSLKCQKETQQSYAMCDHCSGTGTECNEDKHAEIPVPVPVRYMRTRKKTQTPVRKNCVDSYAPSITVQSALWKRTLSRAPEFAKHGPGALFQQHPLRCFPPSLGLPLWSVALPSLAEAGRHELLRKNQ